MMDEFATLARPSQSPVKVDPTPKHPEADGFNYPTFRLLNKKARTVLSDPINPQSSNYYRLFTIANSRGWFAAAVTFGTSYEIIVSTLGDLRTALKAAGDASKDQFIPKRSLVLSGGNPNIITFASNDTRLIVGIEDGSILVYDTAQLFSAGSEDIPPVHVSLSSSSLRQIVPNPGIEPSLADLVAIVRDDGTVQVVNTQLENQGGWTSGGDSNLKPVAASWSPKGKHLAIGLQAGDVFTFAPGNKTTPNKYIPPTADANLVSLDWIGPGHTFRTSYAPRVPNESEPTHHIITLDTKTCTAIYVALTFPFSSSDRPQHSFIMALPKWDEDSATSNEEKSLIVVGDTSAVDLEVIAHSGNQWYQESQENPLSLPLDSDMNDTMLLSLEADLTDTDSGSPIMYAYLNDGTIQGWYAEHSKPYVGLVTASTTAPQVIQPPQNDVPMPITTAQPAFGRSSAPTTNTFGQPPAFEQNSFGQKPTEPFGATSAPSGGGFSAFASTGASIFGGAGATNTFGTGSPFGGGTSQQPNASPFGSGTASAFGGSGGTGSNGSVFGNSGSTGNAFSAFSATSGSGNAFGQPSFGVAASSASPAAGSNENLATAPTFTREASMQDSTPSFGGLSLGGDNNSASTQTTNNGIFGSFGPTPAKPESTAAFGSAIKPATGFGAFNNVPTPSAPANTTSDATKAASHPGFGKSAFGQTSFAQTGFGNQSFGKSSLVTAAPSASSSGGGGGGFSAFASQPATFIAVAQQGASASKPASTTASSGGFSAFASGTPTSFSGNSKDPGSTPLQESSKAPAFGSNGPVSVSSNSPFTSTTSSSASATTTPSKSPFAARETTTPTGSPAKPFGIASPSSSPESSPTIKSVVPPQSTTPVSTFKSSTPGPTTGAFGNIQSSPSVFKPASGFGAFGSDQITSSSSPFFKKPEPSTPPVSVFASAQPSVMQGSTTPSNSPSFGSPSLIGKVSAFPTTPATPTPAKSSQAASAFSAFSGSSAGFSSFAGPKKSFTELLRNEVDSEDPIKPSTAAAENVTKKSGPVFGTTPVSVFHPQKPIPSIPNVTSVFSKEGSKQEPSKSENTGVKKDASTDSISEEPVNISSASSSFVEVDAEDFDEGEEGEREKSEEGEVDEDEDEDDDDDSSFLSDSVKSHESSDVSSSDESDEEEDNEEGVSTTSSIAEAIKTPLPPSRSSSITEAIETPLPPSRSPSSTPQPETPRIEVTPSATPLREESSSSESSERVSERESSTTPPGTPTKEVVSVFSKPFASSPPVPASPPVTPTPFGLGPGRHSTRPTRSSPLASTPVSGDDDDDNEEQEDDEGAEKTAKITPVPVIKSPISPKVVTSSLSVKMEAPLKGQSSEEVSPTSRRPKTPPLLSSGGKVPPMPSTPVLAHAVPPAQKETTTPPVPSSVVPAVSKSEPSKGVVPPSSFFSKPPVKPEPVHPASTPAPNSLFGPSASTAASSKALATNIFGASSFSIKGSATPSSSTSASTGGIFGGTSFALPTQQPGSVPQNASASLFQSVPKTPPGKPSAFTLTPPSGSSSPNFSLPPSLPKTPVPAAAPPAPEMTMEEGMQKECARLIMHLEKELTDLKGLAEAATKKRVELGKPAGGLPKKGDLGDNSKWALSNVSQFGQVLRQYEKDLVVLREQREHLKQAVRDLQSNMLKATTRKEEIARFNKANNDEDFARMLRSRTLGPEHLESQTQLRRNIRNMRDRIQNLESNLRVSKKRLAQFSTGKPSLRAPSLDTISRTYRNIDIAVQQQSDAVSKLASRVAKLEIGGPKTPKKNARDSRLPDNASRRPFNMTPNVATTTAAALNAERSAHNLKRALLSIRSEPLLNKEVASAPPPPVVFTTPQKAEGSKLPFEFKTPMTGPLFSTPAQDAPVTPDSNWTLPDDDFSPTVYTPTQRRSTGSGQKKHGSVALPVKRSPGMSPTPPPAFNWGPLPKFDNPPLHPLPANVKLDLGKSGDKGKSN